MSSDEMVKIHITFPRQSEMGGPAGEYMWAEKTDKPDHFKVNNLPFYAYGVCYKDIVRCEATDDYQNEVVEVVEYSQLTLFRVFFVIEDEETYLGITKGMDDKFGTNWERAQGNLFSVTVPDENAQAFFDELDRLHDKGLLHFETCQQRSEDHFGPVPDEEEE